MPFTNTFLITLTRSDNSISLKANEKRPCLSNLIPIEIRIQRSANKKDLNVQKCKYIPAKDTEYNEDSRCYVQIWELDNWIVITNKKGKTVKEVGKEQDAIAANSAKAKKNDFLAEFGGFIKEIKKGKEYKFITDDKGTTIPSAPADKKMGNLKFKIDQLQKDKNLIKKDVIVPIQGELENILEIGVVYQDKANQKNYADNYSRPVYHIRNLTKIIQEQLDEGGLRMICYTEYNRNFDQADLLFYSRNRDNKEIKGTKKIPKVTKDVDQNLKNWLTGLKAKKIYDGDIPANSSTRSIYKIVNDANFPYASGNLAKEVNSLYINSKNEIDIGRFKIFDWKEIKGNVDKLIEEVYKQYMDSTGEKPKVLKLGIYCHGVPTLLCTAGRLPDQTDIKNKRGGNLEIGKLTEFVNSFIVDEGKTKRMLLADNIVIALYACLTARSSFTKDKDDADTTYGQSPPNGHSLGENSFARSLRDELQKDGLFPKSCIYGHTTKGDADGNPFVRLFYSGNEKDLINFKNLNRESRRNKMFENLTV